MPKAVFTAAMLPPDEDYTSHGLISTVDQIFTSQLDVTEGNDLSILLNGETEALPSISTPPGTPVMHLIIITLSEPS